MLAAVLALMIEVGLMHWRPGAAPAQMPTGPAPDRPPIAVLNFRDPAASVEDQAMARAHAVELVGELSRNADLKVIAAYSSFTLADRGESPKQVAAGLGARYWSMVSFGTKARRCVFRCS